VLGDLFYHLGVAAGGFGPRLTGKHGAGASAAGLRHDLPGPGPEDPEDPGDAPLGHAGGLVAGAAGAWLIAKVLRPRPVSWTRVVLAGVAATFLADMAVRAFDRDRAAGRIPLADDPESLLRKFGAGIATAAGYAALLYPRLPGSPLARGLAYGAMEVAAAPRGGLVRMAADIPGLRYPLQGLALPEEDDASPYAHLAFGLGLGLFYRYDPGDDESDE
jgi:hypothetical protein